MKLFLKVALAIGLMLLAWRFWPGAVSPASGQSTAPKIKPAAQMDAAAKPQPLDLTTEPFAETISQLEPAQVCLQPEQLSQALTQLQQKRVSLTHQLIDVHIELGIKKPVTLRALQAVGGDLEVFQYRQSAQKYNVARFRQQPRRTHIDKDTFLNIHTAIGQQDYDQVLKLIQQFPLADRPGLITHSDLSVLGHVIIGHPQIPFSTIQQFIDVGIEPLLSDLAAFTALDLPLPLIDMVQQHYKGDLQQQWQDNFRTYNLTLLAAENASVVLFDYWRALGIPASLGPQAPNAFDLMPLPSSEQQLAQQIGKVRTLLAAGILPRAADARSQWLLLLPKQESTQLNELLQQQPVQQMENDGPDATQLTALVQLQHEFNQLLQQVAACPQAQQWPIGVATVRDLPERYYLTNLKLQQQSSQRMNELTTQERNDIQQMTAMVEKKDWQGMQDLLRQQPEMPAEDVEVSVLMFMMMFQASEDDLKLHINSLSQLSNEQAKQLSQAASPAHRALFKAAGFDIPANAEADKRHQLRERKRATPATSGAR